jgi:hypothetical protein
MCALSSAKEAKACFCALRLLRSDDMLRVQRVLHTLLAFVLPHVLHDRVRQHFVALLLHASTRLNLSRRYDDAAEAVYCLACLARS